MRLGFDVTPTLIGASGVARYVSSLAGALAAGPDAPELVPFAWGRLSRPAPPGTAHLGVPLRVLHRLWPLVGRPRVERLTGPVDVVHVTDLVPAPSRAPVVLNVHDLDALLLPDLHSGRARRLQRTQLEAARRVPVVVTCSATTGGVLIARGVPEDRIVVAPYGVTPLADPATGGPPPGLAATAPFLLAVGTIDRRKGLDTLVAAMARDPAPDHQLVLAGGDGVGADEVRAAVADAGLQHRVLLCGRVDEATLSWLYHHCTLLCLPSRAEGFGFTPLEAGSAGAAVVASDLPITREVAGEGAHFVPVGDVDAWAAAIAGLVADDAARAALGRAGRLRSATFTWERCAALHRDAYRRAAASA